MPAARPHLRALTGIRFFAAFHVVLFHCAPWRAWGPFCRSVVGAGYVAVSLFFVLSGFILSYTYAGRGASVAAGRVDFYAGRFARIYPVYALGLLLMAPFFVVSHVRARAFGALVVEAVAVAALVQAHAPSLAVAWNPPAWSLSAEAFFYLAFPFVAPRLFTCRRRTAIGVAGACWALSLSASLAYVLARPDGVATPSVETVAPWLDLLKYGPIVRLPEFVIGVVAGRVFLEPGAREPLAAHAAWVSVAASALVLGVLAASERIPYVLLHDGLLAPVFAALVIALAHGAGPLARLLARPSATLLGEASYSLYILHTPVLIYCRKASAALLGDGSTRGPLFTVGFLVTVVACSVACLRLVELPMRSRVKSALLASGRGRPAPA